MAKTKPVYKTIRSKFFVDFCDIFIAENGIPAHGQPFFGNILMDGDPEVILKNMGNMVFAHKKSFGEAV